MSVYYAGLYGDVLICGLKGEDRRDWEVDLRYEEQKNHMITLESIELVFWRILYLFTFILVKSGDTLILFYYFFKDIYPLALKFCKV